MEVQKKFVTPEYAQEMLKANTRNRPLSPRLVLRYANLMKEGQWKEDTFELIKISEKGEILDGQHRLEAIVKSGVGLWLHIANGLKDDVFDVLDTGKRRTGGDTLAVLGVTNAIVISAGIALETWIKNKCTGERNSNLNSLTLKEYEKNPKAWAEAAKNSHTLSANFSGALSPSWVCAFLYHFTKIDYEDAVDFMSQLCTGKDIKNNTVHILRKKLIDLRLSAQVKLSTDVKAAIIIKSWNCFRNGSELSIIRHRPVEEKFPVAI